MKRETTQGNEVERDKIVCKWSAGVDECCICAWRRLINAVMKMMTERQYTVHCETIHVSAKREAITLLARNLNIYLRQK
jgi:hypothetical protein